MVDEHSVSGDRAMVVVDNRDNRVVRELERDVDDEVGHEPLAVVNVSLGGLAIIRRTAISTDIAWAVVPAACISVGDQESICS